MPREYVYSDKVTRPGAPHCHACKVGNLVFVSGTTPFFDDRQIAKGDFPAQMRQVMENIKSILSDCGTTMDLIVKVNVFLARIQDFQEMNEIFKSYFPDGNYPARTTVEAKLPLKDFLLEIECVAEV